MLQKKKKYTMRLELKARMRLELKLNDVVSKQKRNDEEAQNETRSYTYL
jgi:hypothetical protein